MPNNWRYSEHLKDIFRENPEEGETILKLLHSMLEIWVSEFLEEEEQLDKLCNKNGEPLEINEEAEVILSKYRDKIKCGSQCPLEEFLDEICAANIKIIIGAFCGYFYQHVEVGEQAYKNNWLPLRESLRRQGEDTFKHLSETGIFSLPQFCPEEKFDFDPMELSVIHSENLRHLKKVFEQGTSFRRTEDTFKDKTRPFVVSFFRLGQIIFLKELIYEIEYIKAELPYVTI